MKNFTESENSTELKKAKAEGYRDDFIFKDEFVFWDQQPDIKYWIASVERQSAACLRTETIVFRIQLPCGRKGCAVFDYNLFNNE